jgi:hypothetical protein
VLRNAWILSLLQKAHTENLARVYLPEQERKELPLLAQHLTRSEMSYNLVGKLKGTFPEFAASYHSWHRLWTATAQLDNCLEEALACAEEALSSLSSLLGPNLFFPVGQRVKDSAAGVLDVLVYGYVRSITRSLAGSSLETLIADNLREHANRVHNAVFGG